MTVNELLRHQLAAAGYSCDEALAHRVLERMIRVVISELELKISPMRTTRSISYRSDTSSLCAAITRKFRNVTPESRNTTTWHARRGCTEQVIWLVASRNNIDPRGINVAAMEPFLVPIFDRLGIAEI